MKKKKAVSQDAVEKLRPGFVEVTVCEQHTHNGVDKQQGDLIVVPAPTASVLVKAGAAKYL